jgi:light-regulated signal transduction histidine kinase (bacteriophytochrome)
LIGEAIRRFYAEAELCRYRDRLEELVQQRTTELKTTNAQLQQEIGERRRTEAVLRHTADELARSNRDLEQFAYVASHDLQEPLRAVAGYVELLQHRMPEKLDPKAIQFITGAADGAIRMQTLINDLLAFSRVGTQGKGFRPTDLGAALDAALASLRVSIQETGARVTADPLPTLNVDGTQITQVFQNLIGNAIKFRSDQRPEVRVRVQRQADRWLFSICDNGIGLDPQYAERIFLIFQRLHTRRRYPGTGIGLAICKRIVERHEGRIWVESQPGQGAVFHFTLPDEGKPEP